MDIKLPFQLGLYEKAFPDDCSWHERLSMTQESGFDFVEMSIDESDWRFERLDWDTQERNALKQDITDAGVPIKSMCLSIHRRYPLGSSSASIRSQSLEILKKAIDFALALNIRVILVPGYDVFYETSDSGTQERFLDGLRHAEALASKACIMLALENTDKYVTSISQALWTIQQLNSPWFQLYGDVGNLVAVELDVIKELDVGRGHFAGIHLKDTLPDTFRGVPFGDGHVPFEKVFCKLSEIGFHGPITLEMWNTAKKSPLENLRKIHTWVEERYTLSLDS